MNSGTFAVRRQVTRNCATSCTCTPASTQLACTTRTARNKLVARCNPSHCKPLWDLHQQPCSNKKGSGNLHCSGLLSHVMCCVSSYSEQRPLAAGHASSCVRTAPRRRFELPDMLFLGTTEEWKSGPLQCPTRDGHDQGFEPVVRYLPRRGSWIPAQRKCFTLWAPQRCQSKAPQYH